MGFLLPPPPSSGYSSTYRCLSFLSRSPTLLPPSETRSAWLKHAIVPPVIQTCLYSRTHITTTWQLRGWCVRVCLSLSHTLSLALSRARLLCPSFYLSHPLVFDTPDRRRPSVSQRPLTSCRPATSGSHIRTAVKPAGGPPEALADAHTATVSDVAATAAATVASAAQGVCRRLRTYAREFMHACVCVCVCVCV